MTVGRLAPTPSGLLHIGNGRSFLLAWLWARSAGGRVLLRIEDIDRARCKSEYVQAAIDDLAWLGLNHDGEIIIQSQRTELYRAHLQRLVEAGLAYPCTCTRRDIEEAGGAPHWDDGPVYPGTCRGRWRDAAHARAETGREPAMRFLWQGAQVRFHDALRGEVTVDPSTHGDFVLWRRDDLPSYQLAVTVDDALQGVTQVLRGRDLLTSTARQLALYEALGLNAPAEWAHVPFVSDAGGRMAKRDGSLALRTLRESGVEATRLIGMLAWSAGVKAQPTPASAGDLTAGFDVRKIPESDFVLTDQHLVQLRA
jgi:glutamyl-tRNA synthetase